MNYLEMEQKVINWYKNISPCIKKSFLISFVLINIAFLFHTTNFMFGDHDWLYVKGQTYWKEGTFEGRPLHFVLQSILFSGQILPLLNNLFSFFALTLSSIMLAKYWRVPETTTNYTLFATFIGVIPYTLVWLYYAKDALINLSLPLIVISGLMLGNKASISKKYYLHIISVLLFTFAFSCYVAVIDMVGICLLGSIIVDYAIYKENITNIVKKNILVALDVIIALIAFKAFISMFPLTSSYNTKTIPLDLLWEKLQLTFSVMFTQFTAILPFMEYKYKLLLLVMTVIGALSLLYLSGIKRFIPTLLMCLVLLFISKFAYFIADQRGEILAEMEDFAFVPRLDFYGLVYVYAFFLMFIFLIPIEKIRKVGLIIAVIITFMSIVRDAYALKVWKFGFDAEMKAHERIVSRLEQHKDFDANRQYQLLQVGSLSLRKNYYKKQKNEKKGLDLLETSFTPQYMSRIVYNFYYPKDIFYNNASASSLSQKGKDYLKNIAKPWPDKNSIYIDDNIVIIVLSEEGLNKVR